MTRMGILGFVLTAVLSASFTAAQQTLDLPAVNRCRAEAENHPSRSQMIDVWLARARQNDAVAAFCLSYIPSDKIEVPVGWLEQAAILGLPDAQLLLGANYEVGMSFNQNFTEALAWYRKAADQDFPYAEFELADIYFEGRAGQKKNPRDAYFWALLAKRHEFLAADRILKVLDGQLPAGEKQKVRSRVEQWVKKPRPKHLS